MLNVGIFIQTLDVAFKRPHRTQWLMTNRAHPRTARLGNCYRRDQLFLHLRQGIDTLERTPQLLCANRPLRCKAASVIAASRSAAATARSAARCCRSTIIDSAKVVTWNCNLSTADIICDSSVGSGWPPVAQAGMSPKQLAGDEEAPNKSTPKQGANGQGLP
jgi:hypothetical protein